MRVNKSYSVTYTLDETKTILIRSIFGEITMPQIVDLWESDLRNKKVTSDLKVIITDFSNGKNLAKMEERELIRNFYLNNIDFFKNIKIAVVLNDPTIAIPLMYEHENNDLEHVSFSTLKGALEWAKEKSLHVK